MTVSVIIPVYNREEYIESALDSVLSQTYQDFEVVVVDDGSDDTSPDIVLSYANKYPNKIKFFKQENSGPSRAKNAALKNSAGEFIAFLDSDDYWHPNKLEEQLRIAQKLNDFAFIYSGYNIVDHSGNILEECYPDERFSGHIYDKLWLINNKISGGTLLVKRDNLLHLGGFDENLQGAENLDMRLRLSKLGPVYYSNNLLYYYRKHSSNLTLQADIMNLSHYYLIKKHFKSENYITNILFRRVMARYYYNIGVQKYLFDDYKGIYTLLIKSICLDISNASAYLLLMKCFLGLGK